MNIALFCSLIILFFIFHIKVLWFWLIHDCTWKIFIMNDSQPFWWDDYSSHSWNTKKQAKSNRLIKNLMLIINGHSILLVRHFMRRCNWNIFVVFDHAYQKIAKKNNRSPRWRSCDFNTMDSGHYGGP